MSPGFDFLFPQHVFNRRTPSQPAGKFVLWPGSVAVRTELFPVMRRAGSFPITISVLSLQKARMSATSTSGSEKPNTSGSVPGMSALKLSDHSAARASPCRRAARLLRLSVHSINRSPLQVTRIILRPSGRSNSWVRISWTRLPSRHTIHIISVVRAARNDTNGRLEQTMCYANMRGDTRTHSAIQDCYKDRRSKTSQIESKTARTILPACFEVVQ